MNLADIFYLTATVGIIFTLIIVFVISFQIFKVISMVKALLRKSKEGIEGITMLKEGVQVGALQIVSKILKKIGGDSSGKK